MALQVLQVLIHKLLFQIQRQMYITTVQITAVWEQKHLYKILEIQLLLSLLLLESIITALEINIILMELFLR